MNIESVPFTHSVNEDFFDKTQIEEVFEALTQEEFVLKHSDLFQFSQTHDLISTQSKVLKNFISILYSDEFISKVEAVTNLSLSRNTIDIHGTLYGDTDFLLCHDDELGGRKIAFLIYLTDLEESDGGALMLYDSKEGKPHKIVKKVYTKKNQFTFFEVSPISFHQVEEVVTDTQRIAIGGWYHESK